MPQERSRLPTHDIRCDRDFTAVDPDDAFPGADLSEALRIDDRPRAAGEDDVARLVDRREGTLPGQVEADAQLVRSRR